MRPFWRSPVIAVVPAPTIRPAVAALPPNVATRPEPGRTKLSPTPASIGSSFLRNDASGSPVWGFTVSEPPAAIASPWRLLTSLGVMCTSMVSSPRPMLWSCCAIGFCIVDRPLTAGRPPVVPGIGVPSCGAVFAPPTGVYGDGAACKFIVVPTLWPRLYP